MRAIIFCITPKGDLPHYSHIVRNLEPLGTDIKYMACYRLDIMLYIEIKNEKEAKETAE